LVGVYLIRAKPVDFNKGFRPGPSPEDLRCVWTPAVVCEGDSSTQV